MSLCFVVGQSLASLALCGLGRTLGGQSLTSLTNLATVMNSHFLHLL